MYYISVDNNKLIIRVSAKRWIIKLICYILVEENVQTQTDIIFDRRLIYSSILYMFIQL